MKKLRYFLYLAVGMAGIAALAARHYSEPAFTASVNQQELARHQYPFRLYSYVADKVLADQYRSPWRESIKDVYRNRLAGTRPDVLVFPFEEQMYTLDKIGRNLMARLLIRSLKRQSGQSVSGFDSVDRALDYNRPRFTDVEVDALVRVVEPSKYVRTYVGHKDWKSMYVTVVVYTQDSVSPGAYKEAGRKTWEALPFDDENLPYRIFADKIDEIAQFVDPEHFTDTDTQPALASRSEILALPGSPAEMLDLVGTDPVVQAFALQTLGILTPVTSSRERNRLFERSLMNVLDIPPAHPDYELLKARALFYLARRPAAIAALRRVNTIESQVLRQYLNANLVALSTSVEEITSPWKQLFSRIELNQLANSFGYGKEIIPGWTQEFYASHPHWQPLVETILTASDEFMRVPVVDVKKELDTIYPWPIHSLESALLGRSRGLARDEIDLALTEAIANHTQAALKSFSLSDSNSTGANRLDLVNLLDGIAQWAAIKRLRLLLDIQALPGRASTIAGQYLRIYDGHEDIVLHEFRANLQIWQNERGVAKAAFKKSYPDALKRVVDLAYVDDGEYYRYQSELQAFHWKLRSGNNERLQLMHQLEWRKDNVRVIFPPRHVEGIRTRIPARTLAYVHDDLNALWLEYTEIKKKDEKAAQAIWSNNGHRFEGHRRLPDVMALVTADKLSDESAQERDRLLGEHYQKQVDGRSIEWSPYLETASRLCVMGRYADALAVFNRYPGFQPASTESSLGRANLAFKAGTEFFWRGAHEQAVPLYELSASQHTGSHAEMASQARLATIRGDYASAILHHYQRGTRYNSQHGFRDSMSLLHVVGQSEQAWALFDALLGRYQQPTIWESALVGHHVSGASGSDIFSWLSDESKQSDDSQRLWYLRNFALMALTMDRPADGEAPELIERIGKGNERQVRSISKFDNEKSLVKFEKNGLFAGKATMSNDLIDSIIRVGDAVPSEHALFASGYNAMKQGDFERANRFLVSSFGIYHPSNHYYTHYSFPYLVRVAKKVGKEDTLKLVFDQAREDDLEFLRDSKAFDYHLGLAFIAAEDGDHDKALKYLNWAFGIKPYAEYRPVMPWFQVVEAALWLYEDFKDPRYLSRAMELAKSYQVIAPMHAWSFAVVAKYSEESDERLQALATALYLDRHSRLVSEIPEAEQQAAREWFEEMRSQGKAQDEAGEKKRKAPEQTQSRFDAPGKWGQVQLLDRLWPQPWYWPLAHRVG